MTIEIGDCETDNLLDKMTKLHMLQLGTAGGDDVTIYCDTAPPEEIEKAHSLGLTAPIRPLAEGVERLRAADRAVFHNLIGFDMPAINRFYPGTLSVAKGALDSLILSRLKNPDDRLHSLDALGRKLGVLKGAYKGDYQTVDAEFLVYAEQDVRSGRAIWHSVKEVLSWGDVAALEHQFAEVMWLQERHGFRLNIKKVTDLYAELRDIMSAKDAELQVLFPPIEVETTFVPKAPNKTKGWLKGVPTIKRHTEVFNPASGPMVAKRLMALGWKPKHYTEKGHVEVSKTVLQTMRHPAAAVLLARSEAAKKIAQISDGKTGWMKVMDADNVVRGRVVTIGCAPGRCSHSAPNMANVNKKDMRMREVWEPRPGRVLIGVDGDGIQARAFAHYLTRYDGGAFRDRLLNGKKGDRTDVHSANLASLINAGCVPMDLGADQHLWDLGRDNIAKRCLYASWFGGQAATVGWTVKDGCRTMKLKPPGIAERDLGAAAIHALNSAMQGAKELVTAMQDVGKSRGYLVSPAGRRIPIPSKHVTLVYLLQAVETDIMKTAAARFHFGVAPMRGWVHGRDFDYCAHVHDEAQLEALPELAEAIGTAYAECIDEAGVLLKLKCPHKGSMKIGRNWAETH